MEIKSINIQNFRSIESFRITECKRLNAFIGNNGDGKSSVLAAINILYSWLAARIRNNNGTGLQISADDVRHGADGCFLEICCEIDDETLHWSLYKRSSTNREKSDLKTDLSELTRYANKLATRGVSKSWPLVINYGVNRSVIKTPLRRGYKQNLDTLHLYDSKEYSEGTDLSSFMLWYREREDLENAQIRERKDLGYRDPQLEVIRKGVGRCFSEYTDFHMKRNPTAFVMSKNGEEFSFEQLSDGERCYIAMVMDICRKLAMTAVGKEDALDIPVVVLIDEVDLHLHPSWQHTVLEKLLHTFPRCQFFVSTNSPLVLSSVDLQSANVFRMHEGKAVAVFNTYGKRFQDILLDDFRVVSTRASQIDEMMSLAWEKVSDKDIEGAQVLADELSRIIPRDQELASLKFNILKMRKANAQVQ